MSDPSPFCLRLIRTFEELRLNAYRDVKGIATIGYGHVILPGEALSTITETHAEQLLFEDAKLARRAVFDGLPESLVGMPWEADALTSFVFNAGAGAWRESTLRSYVLSGDHYAAAHQFRRWVHAGHAVVPGLVRRRAAEEVLYLGAHESTVMAIARGVWR